MAAYIQAFGVKRWVAVIILVVITALFLAVLGLILIPIILKEIDIFSANFPSYYQYIYEKFISLKLYLEQHFPILQTLDIGGTLESKITSLAYSAANLMTKYLRNIVGVVSGIFLIPILVFFMLLGGNKWLNVVVDLVPSNFIETLLAIFYEVDSLFGHYLRAQLIEVCFIASAVTIVLSVIGLHFAFFVGLCAGLLNFIPYLGSITGLVLASILGIAQFHDIFILLKIIPAFLIVQFVDNHAVQPWVFGTNVNLSPAAIMFAIVAGAELFGFIGMIFAVPVLAIIKSVFFILLKRYRDTSYS
jgi:predicted PurR-regulated permease PerM